MQTSQTIQQRRSIQERLSLKKPDDVSIIELASAVLDLDVEYKPDEKIVVDERTGTIVSGINAVVSPVVITHGAITIKIEPNSYEEAAQMM